MNDLAEKALHGLNAARREIVARPMISFAVAGLLLAGVVVAADARISAAGPTRPLSTWFGLADAVRHREWLPGTIMLCATIALALLWLGIVRFARRRDQPESRVWLVAAAWALPFVLGPPLLGTSAQTYVAFGLLQRHGLSPYDFGPSRLAASDIVAAIEPSARDTPSSAGPLGTLVQHLAVSISSGSAL
ncbi:MAG: alpha,6-mannosyltransferase, partial [Pseudonocardiales bacterium]|nr:alpha,6-mannosyltransferase [Pseudonocardiales bacterium]